MRCALVHVSRGVDGTPISPAVDHLGLASLEGSLTHAGHEVLVFDSFLQAIPENRLPEALAEFGPDMIGFALNYSNRAPSCAIARTMSHVCPGVPLFAGGHYATFHVDELLAPVGPFCAVIQGEGEIPLFTMAKQGPSPKRWGSIPGVTAVHNGQRLSSPPEPPPDLDTLAPRSLVQLAHLRRFPRGCSRTAIEASRGCAYACSFCSIAACQRLANEARRRRCREPRAVAAEIATIADTFGLRDFWFMDADVLGPSSQQEHAMALARAIKNLRREITLEIDTRADAITPEIVSAFKDAGLERCFLGIESFDGPTLARLAKRTTPETNLRAIQTLEHHGVRPIVGIIMFHPESTVEQLRKDHAVLRLIGYEKTQMLFRLKKYKGSIDAGELADSDGKGVAPWADYGWEFSDPLIQEIWNRFDALRLQAMDEVFLRLTNELRAGTLTPTAFTQQSDAIFHAFGEAVDAILG